MDQDWEIPLKWVFSASYHNYVYPWCVTCPCPFLSPIFLTYPPFLPLLLCWTMRVLLLVHGLWRLASGTFCPLAACQQWTDSLNQAGALSAPPLPPPYVCRHYFGNPFWFHWHHEQAFYKLRHFQGVVLTPHTWMPQPYVIKTLMPSSKVEDFCFACVFHLIQIFQSNVHFKQSQ